MIDTASLNRMKEAERVLLQAIEDVPLTCDAREASAAIQSIGLRMAERCMSPPDIARGLMTQAEGYLKADAAGRGEPETCTEAAHKAFTAAAQLLAQQGIPQPEIREMMLAFAVTWMTNAEGPRQSASVLYRHADALAGRSDTRH